MIEDTIILFGFSGSGKSTMANRISVEYGLRVIHPSGILRDLYEQKEVDLKHTRHNTGFWESSEGIEFFKSRLYAEEPPDVISDRILVTEARKGNVVIDSWSLPWLIDKGIKIYLKTEQTVRAQRVSIRNDICFARASDIINMKDEETRKLFLRLYGFDIARDHDVFGYSIKTDELTQDEVFNDICSYLHH